MGWAQAVHILHQARHCPLLGWEQIKHEIGRGCLLFSFVCFPLMLLGVFSCCGSHRATSTLPRCLKGNRCRSHRTVRWVGCHPARSQATQSYTQCMEPMSFQQSLGSSLGESLPGSVGWLGCFSAAFYNWWWRKMRSVKRHCRLRGGILVHAL